MKRAAQLMKTGVQIAAALVLLALALFCVFGFLVSFEPGNGLTWRLGYATAGCGCLTGSVLLFLRPWQRRLKAAKVILASSSLFFLAVLALWLTAVFHLF